MVSHWQDRALATECNNCLVVLMGSTLAGTLAVEDSSFDVIVTESF
jgi:hypothetical protein